MKRKGFGILATGAGAAFALVAISVAPASASWPYADRFGYADCGNTHPVLYSQATGNVAHQISWDVGDTYQEYDFSNGSVLTAHATHWVFTHSDWATIGYDTYLYYGNWYCGTY